MRKHAITLLLIAALILPTRLMAQSTGNPSQKKLSPAAIFRRCYAQLTGSRVAPTHPLLISVRAGTISPVDACMQVLAKANLMALSDSALSADQKSKILPTDTNVAYTPYTVKDTADAEGVAVLNKMYNFHRMLFTAQDLTGVPPDARLPDRFNDPTEPALFLTRLLFSPDAKYRDAVTGDYAVRGIRSLGPWVRNYYVGGSAITNLTVPATGLERGLLWGVGMYPPGNKAWMSDDGTAHEVLNVVNYSGPVLSTFAAQRSYGGGIMGLHSFLMMNSGFPSTGNIDNPKSDPTERNSGRSNASRRMHRRWALNILNDLLCRPAPPLRAEDVNALVANYVAKYTDPVTQLPFRLSNTCMSCHASLDPMAATARPFFFGFSMYIPWLTQAELTSGIGNNPPIEFISASSLNSKFSGLQPAETPANNEYTMMARDSKFSDRPASGDLRFRSYDGTLVWQHIAATGQFDGLAKLGSALAGTNDLYVCAAAHYLHYFTGIEVNLQDIGDARNPALSKDDLYYRNIAIQLGLRLKDHQSLSTLVRDILSLSLYQKKGLRDVAP